MTQAEMAEALEIAPILLVRPVDRLCQQRLVERRPHESDRRANRLHLTHRGRAMLNRLDRVVHDTSAQALAGFDAAQTGRLLEQLLRIKNNPCAAVASREGRRAANGGRHAG